VLSVLSTVREEPASQLTTIVTGPALDCAPPAEPLSTSSMGSAVRALASGQTSGERSSSSA
jgi:hypothetical protein